MDSDRSKFEAVSKYMVPMALIDHGIEIDFSAKQPASNSSPMEVTESGMVVDVRLLHPTNAHSPMKATDSGKQPTGVNSTAKCVFADVSD